MSTGGSPARLKREYMELRRKPPNIISNLVVDEKNMHEWELLLVPTTEPFNKAAFPLKMTFPPEYPFKPPNVVFKTPVYHPNVEENGRMCFPTINPISWKAGTTVQEVLEELDNMLGNPDVEHALRADAAKIYSENRDLYLKKVAESVAKAGEQRPETK